MNKRVAFIVGKRGSRRFVNHERRDANPNQNREK